jgi:hypothetical protein
MKKSIEISLAEYLESGGKLYNIDLSKTHAKIFITKERAEKAGKITKIWFENDRNSNGDILYRVKFENKDNVVIHPDHIKIKYEIELTDLITSSKKCECAEEQVDMDKFEKYIDKYCPSCW